MRLTRHVSARWLMLVAAIAFVVIRPALGAEPKVPKDFSVRLVATVPAVLYPCQIATAPDGSLFVAEDPMDQVGPYEADNGRILLFREGKEPVVFADKLRAVFGMVWRDGSLYVMHMPRLTVFKDTNGDGKADERKEIFKDLGPGPKALNDHIVSGLQFGLDGRLYISVGDKGVPDAHGPDGTNILLKGGGILRCSPDGTRLEIVSSGTRNHLEPNLDDRDNLFTYDNTDDGLGWWTRVTHHIDGGYYGYPYDYHDFRYRMLDRLAEYGGGSPCGGVVYKEDAWPAEYRNRVMWAEWGKRQVAAASFKPKGASFEVAEMTAFASPPDGQEFRPIDLAISHDGKTLYVADWGMGGWGSKTEKVGRVYAITYTGKAPATRARGKDSDPLEAQLRQLDHPSFNERTRAQLAIIKKGKQALAPAVAALAHEKTDPVAKRHLIWIIEQVAGGSPDATMPLLEALKSPVADVRAQAARALGIFPAGIALDDLQKVAKSDPEPTVRLQALIALGRIGDANALPTLAPTLLNADSYLAFSARQAIRRVDDWGVVAKLTADTKDATLRDALMVAAELVYDKDAVALLRRVLDDTSLPSVQRAKALRFLSFVHRKAPKWDGSWWGTRPAAGDPPVKSLTWEGTPAVLTAIRTAIGDADPVVRLAAVAAVKEAKDRDLLIGLRDRFAVEDDIKVRVEIARTLGTLKDRDSVNLLLTALRTPKNPEPVMEAALAAVEQIGGRPAIDGLVGLLNLKDFPTARQASAIAALGRFRADSGIPAIRSRLKSDVPGLRASAALALGEIGKSAGVVDEIRPLLTDKDLSVRKAAFKAAASLKDREAVPAIVAAANEEATRFEATQALASIPDVRGLQVYLRGLTDRNPELRKASATAIDKIRTNAIPVLERLAARREVPSSALPELRKIFASAVPIHEWRIMGPFDADDRPPVPPGKRVDATVTIKDAKLGDLKWQHATTIDRHGMVDLTTFYAGKNTDRKSAFAFAEVESPESRPARLSIGSDDSIQVWLNGKEVFRHREDRGYTPDENLVDVQLKKGLNLIFVKVGNSGGGWQFSLGVSGTGEYAFLKGPSPGAFDPDAFRQFAVANKGRVDRGKTLFNDPKGIGCIKCHAVAGQGGTVGPDLAGIATRYPKKDELIHSVLYPSAKIFSGYEPTIVATADGKVITGIVKSDTADALVLEDVDAKKLTIKKSDIEERKLSDVSLMPNGLAEGLTREDFADLIGYLETLKEVPPAKPTGGR